MSRQLGTTYTLSVLVVVFCAMALYRPEKPAGRPGRSLAGSEDAPARPGRNMSPEGADPAGGRAPAVAEARPRSPQPRPTPVASNEPRRPDVAIPIAGRFARRPVGSREAFTEVDTGETLADVARRVYGSDEKVEALWKANRDQLPRPDAPIGPGTLLRTP